MRFEVFIAAKLWILVFWVVKSCSLVDGYRSQLFAPVVLTQEDDHWFGGWRGSKIYLDAATERKISIRAGNTIPVVYFSTSHN
jgi:hypothetical protein